MLRKAEDYTQEKKKQQTPASNSKIYEILPIILIIKISLNKLIVKGPPKFKTTSKNHIILILGNSLNKPLFKIELRECDRSYIIFAPANMPGDVNP